jgi:hypothetical protein
MGEREEEEKERAVPPRSIILPPNLHRLKETPANQPLKTKLKTKKIANKIRGGQTKKE